MKKTTGYVSALAVAGIVLGAAAQEETVSKKEFDALQAQVTELTALLNTHQAGTSAAQECDPLKTKSGLLPLTEASAHFPEGMEFGALVEVEAVYSSTESEDASDIALATVELATGWQLMDWLRADLVFLYEEDDTPFDVDQAIITLGNTDEFPLFFQAGKMYVPFGNFDSYFISDPVVLELAESLESGALVGFEKGGFLATLSAFNGDVATDGEDQVDNLVAAASYGVEGENSSLTFGAAWIRNVMDSDGLTGVLADNFFAVDTDATSDDTGGVNAWATAMYGPVTLIGEYVEALSEFGVNGVDQGFKPASLNLELGYALSGRVDVAAKFEKSDDVADWFAENRYGMVCSYLLSETDFCCAGVALEYMREDYAAGAEDADLVTMQIAVEF